MNYNSKPEPAPLDEDNQNGPEEPEPPSSSISIDIQLDESIEQDQSIIDHIALYLDQACKIQSIGSGHISIYITHDHEMAELHSEHTGIHGTTDILTFDLRDDINNHTIVEVDIVLCIDEAKRQAKSRNHRLIDELLLYSIHGLLHVQGYNDHEESDYQRMHKQEDHILTELGIGVIFNLEGNH